MIPRLESAVSVPAGAVAASPPAGTPAGERPRLALPSLLFPPLEVLGAFVASRLTFLLVYGLAPVVMAHVAKESNLRWPPWRHWVESVHAALFSIDSGWYQSIAVGGYLRAPFDSVPGQANWGFFPLFPLLARVVGGGDWAGIALCNVLMISGLAVTHVLLTHFTDRDRASRALTLLLFFPASYGLSGYRTEPLFILLTAGAILAACRDRFWLAGVLGALAAATRAQGILIVIPLAIVYGQRRGRRPTVQAASLALPPLGLAAFAFHLWRLTGHPFAWAAIQRRSWEHELRSPAAVLWNAIVDSPRLIGYFGWDFTVFNLLICALALGACGWLFATRHWSLAAYALASVLMPILGGLPGLPARYLLPNFPVFLACAGRGRAPAYGLLLGTTAVVQGAYAVWMALGLYAAA